MTLLDGKHPNNSFFKGVIIICIFLHRFGSHFLVKLITVSFEIVTLKPIRINIKGPLF